MIAQLLLIPLFLIGQYRPSGSVRPVSGGSGAVYVNSAIGANTGLDTPSVINYSCATTGNLLTEWVYYDGVGVTGYFLTGSWTQKLVGQSAGLVPYILSCPDTSSHTYTYTVTCTSCGGHLFSYIAETTGTFDAAGPGSGSLPPASTSLVASATATTSSGMCIVFGLSHSFTPTPPSGYTMVYDDGVSNFFYNNTCYSSTGSVTFSAPLIGASSGEYETSIFLVH